MRSVIETPNSLEIVLAGQNERQGGA